MGKIREENQEKSNVPTMPNMAVNTRSRKLLA